MIAQVKCDACGTIADAEVSAETSGAIRCPRHYYRPCSGRAWIFVETPEQRSIRSLGDRVDGLREEIRRLEAGAKDLVAFVEESTGKSFFDWKVARMRRSEQR
jgi:hypothetical protein